MTCVNIGNVREFYSFTGASVGYYGVPWISVGIAVGQRKRGVRMALYYSAFIYIESCLVAYFKRIVNYVDVRLRPFVYAVGGIEIGRNKVSGLYGFCV